MTTEPLEILLNGEKYILASIDPSHPQKFFPLLCHPAVPYMMQLGVIAHKRKGGIDVTPIDLRILELTEAPVKQMVYCLQASYGVQIPQGVLDAYFLALAKRILDAEPKTAAPGSVDDYDVVSAGNAIADIRNFFNCVSGNIQGVDRQNFKLRYSEK